MRRAALAGLAVALVLAGCGDNVRNHDLAAFTNVKDPTARAILKSIATYRTTKDTALACTLITPHFLSGRFENKVRNCKQVQREASRYLPDSAKVESVTGTTARVLVDEPTATKSVYRMQRVDGVWKIDDILDPSQTGAQP
jgi:hypothetical protein